MKTSALVLGILLALSSISHPSIARAENNENGLDFFPKDMASTVFENDVRMLLPKMKDTQPKLGDNKGSESASSTGTENPESETSAAIPANADPVEPASLKERLSQKYGDPNAEPALRVQDNAPPSFKGMMEALDGDDDELAYDYARQYVKSMQKYQKAYSRVVSMTGQVIKSENQAEGTPWENIPTLYEDQTIAAKKRDEKIRLLMERASKAESATANTSGTATPALLTSRDRKSIHAMFASQKELQGDASGKVDIITFFDPSRAQECWTLNEMRQIAKTRGGDSRVTMVALSMKPAPQAALDAFQHELKLPFAFKDGSALASQLGISQSCTIAAMVPNQKRAVLERGPVTAEFIDELINRLQGA